jgi:hypothetical protein
MTPLSSDQRKERGKMMKTTETMKAILGGVWRLGRGTATVMGLAVLLALTVGVASTALAGTGVGARFDLGTTNTVNAVSKLVGTVVGPSLTIDNNSTGTGATALDLQVEPGKPPFKVNSTTEVKGLNVDSIDSKNSSDFLQESSDRDDFLPSRTYNKDGARVTGTPRQSQSTSVTCDPGDLALSGGYFFLFDEHEVFFERVSGDRYTIGWFNTSFEFGDSGTPNVTCADFPPLRQ